MLTTYGKIDKNLGFDNYRATLYYVKVAGNRLGRNSDKGFDTN